LLDDDKIQYEACAIDFKDTKPLIENIIFNQELCGAARIGIPKGSINLDTTK